MRVIPLLPLFGLLASSCRIPSPSTSRADGFTSDAAAERLHRSVGLLTEVMIHDIFSPPQASRIYAYASIAGYEAAIAGDAAFLSLAGQVNGLAAVPAPEPDRPIHHSLGAVEAFLRVAEALVFSPAEVAEARIALADEARRSLPAEVVEASLAYGEQVADHILAWANTDGYRETRGGPTFTVTDTPGRWRPTPPAYMDAVEPNWNRIRPFVLDSSAQFAPPPPPAFDLSAGSPFFAQTTEVYEVGRTLTPERRAIADFWDCNPYVMHTHGHAMFATKKITPGGHWMGIAGIASKQQGLDFAASAEVYARTAIALADGFISAWDEKYRSALIRPETVINQHLDEAWLPALQTPPFPEYPSGHSVISAAASVVLSDRFGEGYAFTDTTEVAYGLPARDFPSFAAAAEEAAISRLYGGIHFRAAVEEGLVQGRRVGALVVERLRTRPPQMAGLP
jgi:membrane-associated phospholipid phosphatase